MIERNLIGFDRRLDREWLDAAASLTMVGLSGSEVRGQLQKLLETSQGTKAAQNTLTVIGRLWWLAPQKLAPMQSRALKLLQSATPGERIAIHWSLCLAVYPLFLDTARLTGRLLSLQGEVKLQQVEVRVKELWGDRGAIPRAVQRIVRSMVQWGVLRDTDRHGIYQPVPPIRVDENVGALLIEGLLRGQKDGSLLGQQLHCHPALFPFEVSVRPYDLRRRPEFEVLRQGVDVEYVMLRE